MDTENLKAQIKVNCAISDARFWGYYSICGLLMRMRELYMNEHGLLPLQSIPKEAMSQWIALRESEWKDLEHENLRPLVVGGKTYDPFDINGLNAALRRHGLLYGGGLTLFNKPTFFLGQLLRTEELYDYTIYYVGKELCRDLSTSVAMLQGRCIFMRLDTLGMLLWDKGQELRCRKHGGLLKEAFTSLGIDASGFSPEGFYRKIDSLAARLSDLFVLHEVGEAFEDEEQEVWLDILDQSQDRLTEFYVRGIKDLLADTSEMGPLASIIRKKDRPLLVFYLVFLDGIRKELFPEILNAFHVLFEGDDWAAIEAARQSGYRKARELRTLVLKLWKENGREGLGTSVREHLRGKTAAA